MKQQIVTHLKSRKIIAAFTTTLLIAMAKFGALESIAVFWLVGGIPGTTYSLPAFAMFLAMLTALWLTFRFTLRLLDRTNQQA